MNKLFVVLRTCDRVSLASDRIVPKNECILRCLKSLVDSLRNSKFPYELTIVDDASSLETISSMQKIAPEGKFLLLDRRDDQHLSNKEKSRYSVKIAYDYIYSLQSDNLVYVVEDDYLHYPDSIENMLEAYKYFSVFIPNKSIGIFPQDFNQLYPHPKNPFNDTYVKPCYVIPGPDRYYRTTWFTHESFMIPINTIFKYKNHFDSLLNIGKNDYDWEGSTISNVWNSGDVLMLMPMKTLAIHVSKKEDISFFNDDFEKLWNLNEY